jgi:NADH dehydrogenase (ubiquinone) 1 alpha subcomplex subunit 12
MIPAEWFGWIHYKTDFPPTVKAPIKYDWMLKHDDNKSGTDDAYMPYRRG